LKFIRFEISAIAIFISIVLIFDKLLELIMNNDLKTIIVFVAIIALGILAKYGYEMYIHN